MNTMLSMELSRSPKVWRYNLLPASWSVISAESADDFFLEFEVLVGLPMTWYGIHLIKPIADYRDGLFYFHDYEHSRLEAVQSLLDLFLRRRSHLLPLIAPFSLYSMDTQEPVPTPTATNETVMGVLAYLGILVIIPLLVSMNDPFVKFHAKQGLVLFCIEVVISAIGFGFPPFWMIINLINLAVLVLVIIGIVNVAQHQQKELPIVGSLATYFTF
jgi:uncharacterized membrane protein